MYIRAVMRLRRCWRSSDGGKPATNIRGGKRGNHLGNHTVYLLTFIMVPAEVLAHARTPQSASRYPWLMFRVFLFSLLAPPTCVIFVLERTCDWMLKRAGRQVDVTCKAKRAAGHLFVSICGRRHVEETQRRNGGVAG